MKKAIPESALYLITKAKVKSLTRFTFDLVMHVLSCRYRTL